MILLVNAIDHNESFRGSGRTLPFLLYLIMVVNSFFS